MRRFCSPNKQTDRFAGLQNCGRVRRGNGAKQNDLAECRPSRFSGEAHTVLLSEVKTATKRRAWTQGGFFIQLFFKFWLNYRQANRHN